MQRIGKNNYQLQYQNKSLGQNRKKQQKIVIIYRPMLQKNIRYSYSFLDKFAIESKVPTSNDVVLRSRDSSQLILMKEIEVAANEYEETLATLEYQKRLSHEQLLAMVDYYPQVALNKFVVLYEYCSISLMDEFENRLAQRRVFSEPELWSIFTSLAFGLAYLQEQNVGHGSISLFDCFLNEQGFIKISDPTCATSNPYSVVKGYFYAPEILRCLMHDTGEEVNIFKSDAFSLGCCMLQMSLMRDITDIIDYENGLINKAALRCNISDLASSGLSKQYVNFINELLIYDLDCRPDFLGLKAQIFNLLSLDPTEQNQEMMRQSYGIKSSISSLVRSKGQPNMSINVREAREEIEARGQRGQDVKAALNAHLDSLFDNPHEQESRQPLGELRTSTNNQKKPEPLLTLLGDKPNVDHLFGNMKKSIHLDDPQPQPQPYPIRQPENIPPPISAARQQKYPKQHRSSEKVLADIQHIQENIEKIEFNLQKRRRVREAEQDRRRSEVCRWRDSEDGCGVGLGHSGVEDSKAYIIKKQLQQLFADSPQKSHKSTNSIPPYPYPQTTQISNSNITHKTEASKQTWHTSHPCTSQLITPSEPTLLKSYSQYMAPFYSQSYYNANPKSSGQLYTDPSFLLMMQADVQEILNKRKLAHL